MTDELVGKLAEGTHRVEIRIRPETNVSALRKCLERGYVHVLFPDTRGGTELGITIDRSRTDTSRADLETGSGRIRLVGNVSLNFVPTRCVADIDIPSLHGRGRLEVIEPARES